MSDAKLVNIARLMTTYNFEIEQLPDNLKCAQCKLVLKDACQLPCCCRFCRACINEMIARGNEFCPGDSDDCRESLLSRFSTDHLANKKVSKLAVKCPNDGCVHECQLDYMEEHLRECQRKGEECPFRELGCTQETLAAEEMGGHLQHQNRRHSEILIVLITNINRKIETLKRGEKVNSKEIETLKLRDEANSREIESLKLRDEANSREIESLKLRDEANSREIEMLKQELVLKDGQIRLIMDQIINVQNEIKLIKEEKDDLAGRVRILTDGIEREIAERHENDELDRARVIEHVDTEIAVVTRLIESNKDDLISEIQLVKGDIGSINQGVQSINNHICSVNSEVQSIQALVGLGQVDASFVLLIDRSVDKTDWRKGDIKSEYFSGSVYPYKYRLTSGNSDIGTARAALRIQLSIYASPNDGQLAWPFEGKVVITVTDRDRREAYRSITRKCRIERPRDDGFRGSDEWRGSDIFEFLHSKLRKAGQNLTRGVQVSCVIVPGGAS